MKPAIEETRFNSDFRRFLRIICDKTKLTAQEVTRGKSIALGHTKARQLLLWLMHKQGHSTTELANAFGYAQGGAARLIGFFSEADQRKYSAIIAAAHKPLRKIGHPILDAVAEATGVPAQAILSHSKIRPVVHARHMALALFAELNPRASEVQCAQFVGRVNFDTARQSKSNAAKLYETDQEFRAAMDRAKNNCEFS